MEVVIGEKLAVRGYTAEVEKWCRENLVIDNPDFYKKERLGKWTGGTPRQIFLYERFGEWLMLPFGVQKDFLRLFGEGASVWNVFHEKRHVQYESSIKPYDYQQTMIEKAIEAEHGVLVMPCGSGKTQTALEIVARIGGKALWLTHTQDLLHQSMERSKSVFGLDKDMYGTITDGKVSIGQGITFATVQTMSKTDVKQFRGMFDVVIVDECQHCCGSPTRVTQFYKVVSNLCARYKFGLTATPKRSDGLEKSMFALLGGVVHEVTKAEVANTTCPVHVFRYETDYKPNEDVVLAGDGTLNYAALVDDLTHDYKRMMFVIQKIIDLDGPTIVLGNRVEYLQKLATQIKGKRTLCLSGMGTNKKAKAERKDILEKLNNGEIDAVFASYKLAAEGLDCPNLRYVVLATPEKDPSLVQQATGRVGRKADGKSFGTVIDFVDNFGMYRGWAKRRMNVYRKLEYGVDIY